MLRTRLFTAIVLIPIVICGIYWGGLPFLALVTLLLTLAEVEFCHLTARDGFRPALAFGIGMVWLCLLDAQFSTLGLLQPGMALILLGSLAWQLFHRQGSPVADWALTVTGGLYLGLCGSCLIGLRNLQPDGLWWTLTAVPAILLADSGAYLVGRALGRYKLAPTLSPGKTWEGGVGGLFSSLLPAFLFPLFSPIFRLSPGAVFLCAGLSVSGQIGDLAESMLKRHHGVKDSGGILPGHGGVLDRIDGILFAVPVLYGYLTWFVF